MIIKQRHISAYSLILLAVDLGAYYCALFLAYEIRVGIEILPFVGVLDFSFTHFLSIWWLPASLIFFQMTGGLYWRRDPFWLECGNILKALVLSFVVSFSIVSLGQLSASVSRLLLGILFVLLYLLILLFRLAAKHILFKFPYFQSKTMLIGDESRLDEVKAAFERASYMGMNFVEILPVSKATESGLNKMVAAHNITSAVIVPPENAEDADNADKIFKHLHTRVYNIIYVPVPGALDMTNAETGQLFRSQMGYLSVNKALLASHNRIVKRIFDLVISIVFLPFVLAIIGICALAVRLTSKGNAMFRHERIGNNGKAFRIYKLRTMYADAEERLAVMLKTDPAVKAEWESEYKLKNDPRVTTVGKFLRKTSLDELPQLFNVIKGEMSLVGPRPVIKDELDKYYGENAVYYKMVTPGITGLWQVSGRSDTGYAKRVNMDNWYVLNWSLWLDIMIILATPFTVVIKRGAY